MTYGINTLTTYDQDRHPEEKKVVIEDEDFCQDVLDVFVKKGQSVSIKIDTYPNKKFKGKVDSIQLASGAKASLFPPENAVGSYIKVVQRIPVKIVFDEDVSDYTIAPGMSVVPKVKIK